MATHLGTPNFPMGWGDPSDTPQTTIYRERIGRQFLESKFPERLVRHERPNRGQADIEKELRKLFQFDDGWLFTVADQIVYNGKLSWYQLIGSCVGASHVMLLGSKVAHELLVEGDPEGVLGTFDNSPMPFMPYSYGIGRCNNNGQLGRSKIGGDGSLCSWQIEATMTHGFLPCTTPGLPEPVGKPSATTGRAWGSNQGGILNQYREQAVIFDLLESRYISNADDAKDAVLNDKQPLQICSNWGFESSAWDSRYEIEVSRRFGNWSHSMQVVGIIEIKGAWFVVIRNQWGDNYHKKVGRGIPLGCFVVTMDTFSQWIRSSETATIGELKGRQVEQEFPV